MKIPNITIQQLLEAGVHLGHKTLRWNPFTLLFTGWFRVTGEKGFPAGNG